MSRPNTEPNYRSQFEKRVANNLRNRGVKFQYESEVITYSEAVREGKCPECGSGVVLKQRKYTPDFVLPNGVRIEAKGKFTGEMRSKTLAILESNPDLDLRFLFQRDNYITKNKKTRYSEWCEKHGIRYAIGERVPVEWCER